MTSATNLFSSNSPLQTPSTPGLQARPESGAGAQRQTAWIDMFANHAVRHMAANGVMNLKTALEYLIEEDSKHPEQDTRG